MARGLTASVILFLSLVPCACVSKEAAEPTGTQLASQAKESDWEQVLDYKMIQREPRDFTVGYQAEMIVGEFAKGDTFNLKSQAKLYIPNAARGLVHSEFRCSWGPAQSPRSFFTLARRRAAQTQSGSLL